MLASLLAHQSSRLAMSYKTINSWFSQALCLPFKKCLLVVLPLLQILLLGCASPSPETKTANASQYSFTETSSANPYAKEFVAVVEQVKQKGLRPVSFNHDDVAKTIKNILRALDPHYVLLSQTDVERIVQQHSNVQFTTHGYSVFGGVIDAIAKTEAGSLDKDVKPFIQGAVSHNLASNNPAQALNDTPITEWPESEALRIQRIQAMISRDLSLYQQAGYNGVRGLSAEVFYFNETGKVHSAYAHYNL